MTGTRLGAALAVMAIGLLAPAGCGGGDEEGGAESPTAEAPASAGHACELAPRAEIEALVGEQARADGVLNEGEGFTECVYDFGPEVTPILAVTVQDEGAEAELENYMALEADDQVTVERVEGLGDEAVYTEIADFPRLSVRYGEVVIKSSVPDALGRDGAVEVIELVAANLGAG